MYEIAYVTAISTLYTYYLQDECFIHGLSDALISEPRVNDSARIWAPFLGRHLDKPRQRQPLGHQGHFIIFTSPSCLTVPPSG